MKIILAKDVSKLINELIKLPKETTSQKEAKKPYDMIVKFTNIISSRQLTSSRQIEIRNSLAFVWGLYDVAKNFDKVRQGIDIEKECDQYAVLDYLYVYKKFIELLTLTTIDNYDNSALILKCASEKGVLRLSDNEINILLNYNRIR